MTSTLDRTGAAAPPRTARLTRVTISGTLRRADLVLPSDEPVGLLVPDLVAMVGGRPGADPGGYQLTTVDGRALDPAATLRDAGIPDGALVRLDAVTESPPAPILHDVADHVSDDLDQLPGRWNAAALRWTATGIAVLGALVAALLAGPSAGAAGLLIAGAVVAATGVGAALGAHRPVGVAVLLAGMVVVAVAVPHVTPFVPDRAMGWTLVAAITVALLGAVTGRRRAGLMGSGCLLLQLALWWGFGMGGMRLVHAAAVLAVVAIGLLGLLPRLAVTASGLAGLDDRQAGEEPVTRVAAAVAVDAAHRGLAIACVATAASAAVAGWTLARADSRWALALACLTAVAVLLRLRAFPLVVEVVALVGAALTTGAGLLLHWMEVDPDRWWAGAAVALAVTGIGLFLLSYRPRPHVRARARQVADRIEGIAVVVAVPVAVGVFGVFERLLDTF